MKVFSVLFMDILTLVTVVVTVFKWLLFKQQPSFRVTHSFMWYLDTILVIRNNFYYIK